MLENIKIMKDMGRVLTPGKMEKNMLVSIRMMIGMVKVPTGIIMELNILENLKQVKELAKEH